MDRESLGKIDTTLKPNEPASLFLRLTGTGISLCLLRPTVQYNLITPNKQYLVNSGQRQVSRYAHGCTSAKPFNWTIVFVSVYMRGSVIDCWNCVASAMIDADSNCNWATMNCVYLSWKTSNFAMFSCLNLFTFFTCCPTMELGLSTEKPFWSDFLLDMIIC